VSKRLLIRADADARMGTGHVMRCLALAEAWQERGGQVYWLAGAWLSGLDGRLAALGVSVTPVAAAPGSSADADRTAALARELGAAWTVIDGYHFDAAYRTVVAAAGRVLYLDDLVCPDLRGMSLVVNPNPVSLARYGVLPPETQVICGPAYTLLRREFRQARVEPKAPSDPLRLLVTMGGADPVNATARVLEALTQLAAPSLSVRVLLGAGNPNRHALETLANRSPHDVDLISDSPTPSEHMVWADLAIAAAGGTTWELACLGVHTLLLTMADNQRAVAGPMADLGAAHHLGKVQDLTHDALVAGIQPWLANRVSRDFLGKRARHLVDGHGVWRILAAMSGTDLTCREATGADAETVWCWANDPATRQASFQSDAIPWDTHLAWYTSKLADPAGLFWIAEAKGNAIGQVRFACEGETATISVSLAPSSRGLGWGPALISRASHQLLARRPVTTLVALIRQDNERSRRAFDLAGYHLHESTTIGGQPAWDMRLTTTDVR
jgi:UDP-2,4-diacetamido-2,4,6-trideoxy-beta-L-altropyranose hydrolase